MNCNFPNCNKMLDTKRSGYEWCYYHSLVVKKAEDEANNPRW